MRKLLRKLREYLEIHFNVHVLLLSLVVILCFLAYQAYVNPGEFFIEKRNKKYFSEDSCLENLLVLPRGEKERFLYPLKDA